MYRVVAFLVGHSTDKPQELQDFDIASALGITYTELRAMDARDAEICEAILCARALADELRWDMCHNHAGASPRQYIKGRCPEGGIDYFDERCIACIRSKTVSAKSKEERPNSGGNKSRYYHTR